MNKNTIFYIFSVSSIVTFLALLYYISYTQPKNDPSKYYLATYMGDFAFFNTEFQERFFTLTPKINQEDPSLSYNSFGSYVHHD